MRLLLPQILAIMFITKDKTMAVGKAICSKDFTAQANKKAKYRHRGTAHDARREYVELKEGKLSNREGRIKQINK